MGRTGAGAFGFGVNAGLAGASVFLVAGPVAFLADVVPAAPLDDAAAFWAAVPAAPALAGTFFAAGAAFFAGGFAADAVFFDDDEAAFFVAGPPVAFFAAVAFFAPGAAFFDVGAAFFTDPAFFWAERLWAATDLGDVLFPSAAFFAAPGRDPGALFAWAPLLAGVIVSSLTT